MSQANEDRQLRRLETLMDVIYGITIWRLFVLLPKPEGNNLEIGSLIELFTDNTRMIVAVVIGIIIVIIYWLQNNMLFRHLDRTDNVHTAISILQIFSLLLLLYAIRIGNQFPGEPGARILESITAALVGVTSFLAWRRAVKKNLVNKDLSDNDAHSLSVRILAEPGTAVVTIPFAFFTPVLWELAWFVYPVIKNRLQKWAPNL